MQNDPSNRPFVPPPPPSPYGSSFYPQGVLASKAKFIAAEARDALILSIVGLFCFGFILGFLAVRKANGVLETIHIYEVAQDKHSMAMTAKVLGIIDIVLWAMGLLARIIFR